MKTYLRILKWWYERKVTEKFDTKLSLKLDGINKRLDEWKR